MIKKTNRPLARAASNDMDSLVANMLKINTKKTIPKEHGNDYLNNSSILRKKEKSLLGSEFRDHESLELNYLGPDMSLHSIKKK